MALDVALTSLLAFPKERTKTTLLVHRGTAGKKKIKSYWERRKRRKRRSKADQNHMNE